ncbi:hypothetical protein BU23DRAFT_657925, partial [Bimuria novae-zelandiae CBS 107.79]
INYKAKVRRLARPVILGKAKVISFKDLDEARAKRAAKEQALANKPKRGRKRKSDAPKGPTALSPKHDAPGLACASISTWRAPVAKMY